MNPNRQATRPEEEEEVPLSRSSLQGRVSEAGKGVGIGVMIFLMLWFLIGLAGFICSFVCLARARKRAQRCRDRDRETSHSGRERSQKDRNVQRQDHGRDFLLCARIRAFRFFVSVTRLLPLQERWPTRTRWRPCARSCKA